MVKIKSYDGMLDARIATAAIVSSKFLASIVPIYDPKNIDGELLKTVLGWCVDFYRESGEAPRESIQDVFAGKYSSLAPDLADDIGAFLETLSAEYASKGEDINVDYLTKQAEAKFRMVSLRNLAEDIQTATENEDLEEAEEIYSKFERISMTASSVVNPLTDKTKITKAFDHAPEPLYTFAGKLGLLLNSQLCRDSFVAFMGREKIGKTWQLMEHAKRAVKARKNVLFVQSGDLSEQQQILRFAISIAGRSNLQKHCGDILVPCLDCWKNQTGECDDRPDQIEVVEDGDHDNPVYIEWEEADAEGYEPCTECKDKNPKRFQGAVWWTMKRIKRLTAKEAYRINKRFDKATGKGRLRLSCHPTGTVNTTTIAEELHRLERQSGWIPQVIIVDYADIMAPENPRADARTQENDRWKALRRLSQEWNCLVITATQADSKSYDQWLLKMKNFSEDKRKFAHVTAMYGLNQTMYERRRNIMRINPIVIREDDFDAGKWVSVIQSLRTGHPVIASF